MAAGGLRSLPSRRRKAFSPNIRCCVSRFSFPLLFHPPSLVPSRDPIRRFKKEAALLPGLRASHFNGVSSIFFAEPASSHLSVCRSGLASFIPRTREGRRTCEFGRLGRDGPCLLASLHPSLLLYEKRSPKPLFV